MRIWTCDVALSRCSNFEVVASVFVVADGSIPLVNKVETIDIARLDNKVAMVLVAECVVEVVEGIARGVDYTDKVRGAFVEDKTVDYDGGAQAWLEVTCPVDSADLRGMVGMEETIGDGSRSDRLETLVGHDNGHLMVVLGDDMVARSLDTGECSIVGVEFAIFPDEEEVLLHLSVVEG